jgi:hypothetical protein
VHVSDLTTDCTNILQVSSLSIKVQQLERDLKQARKATRKLDALKEELKQEQSEKQELVLKALVAEQQLMQAQEKLAAEQVGVLGCSEVSTELRACVLAGVPAQQDRCRVDMRREECRGLVAYAARLCADTLVLLPCFLLCPTGETESQSSTSRQQQPSGVT